LSSIYGSAKKIAEHEKKFVKNRLTLDQAYPDMVKKSSPKKLYTISPDGTYRRSKPSGSKAVVSVPRRSVGPVSTVMTPPVSIGNVIRGIKSSFVKTNTGHICTGRDFMFSPIGSGTVTTWTMVGGAPISPLAFVDSQLRQYTQMYNKWRCLSFTVHYITSSPTSNNGDIMFYYGKNRESPFVNQTSVNLLPFVISDPQAVIGPQWQNISASFTPSKEWKSADVGVEATPKDYADGELFLLSKTSSIDSPGYVIFDYQFEFAQLSFQPRFLALPSTRQLYNQAAFSVNGGSTVINTTYSILFSGFSLNGSASGAWSGLTNGDVYKVIFDVTNSTANSGFGAITTSFLANLNTSGVTIPFTMSDGVVAYMVYSASALAFTLYQSCVAAYANDRPLTASATGTTTSVLQLWASWVGSVNSAITNTPNF